MRRKAKQLSYYQSQVSNFERVLDFGCGNARLTGANVVTVDFQEKLGPDVVHDLTKFPYPFEDDTFDFIHCSQIVEHLPDTTRTMSELLRIAKPGCKVYLGVPHFSAAIAHNDPTHVSFFSTKTIRYFTDGEITSGNKCLSMVGQHIEFSRIWERIGLSAAFNRLPRTYEEKLHGVFPAKFLHWELVVGELPMASRMAA